MSLVLPHFPIVMPMSSAFTDFMAVALDVELEADEFARSMEASFVQASAAIDNEAARIERALQEFGDIVDQGGAIPEQFFAALIAQNEDTAARAIRDQAKGRKLLVRIAKVVRRFAPHQSETVQGFLGRYDEVSKRYLDVLEQVILTLRALRAEVGRDREHVSTAFSDPKELRRHLRSMN
jgi:hypothetical protein